MQSDNKKQKIRTIKEEDESAAKSSIKKNNSKDFSFN